MLDKRIYNIEPLDNKAVRKAWDRIDVLSKPIGSLGKLEVIAAQIAGIFGNLNLCFKKNIIIMCADNGVHEEGVSVCPQEVTATVTNNFLKGITGVNTLSRFNNVDITVVDIGVKADLDNEKIVNKKIAYGTKNMVKKPAMTKDEVIKAINTGIEMVEEVISKGYNLLGTGEMGIGNTSTSSAVLSVLAGIEPEKTVGKGSGLTEEQYKNKINVVVNSIKNNKPNENDTIDVLAKVGGLDIAGLCGCFLGASINKVPIVIDGLISSTAALCAFKINPLAKEYMFPSHMSAEPGASFVMEELGLKPYLNLEMRLGEGSGCPLAFNIIESAIYTMNNMATFEEALIDNSKYVDIRKQE